MVSGLDLVGDKMEIDIERVYDQKGNALFEKSFPLFESKRKKHLANIVRALVWFGFWAGVLFFLGWVE